MRSITVPPSRLQQHRQGLQLAARDFFVEGCTPAPVQGILTRIIEFIKIQGVTSET